MNSLQFNIFDFFGNVVPGLVILLCFYLLFTESPFTLEAILDLSKSLNAKNSLLLFLLAYVTGFACQFLSYRIFKKIISLYIDKDLSLTTKGKILSKIRHESPNNSLVINRFLALRILGYNMFFASLISIVCFIFSLVYCYDFYGWVNYLFVPIALLIGILFLLRAIDFLKYVHHIIDDTNSII